MLSTLALLCALAQPAVCSEAAPATLPWHSAQDTQASVRSDYHALFEARDEAGLLEVWGANPTLILTTIDEDLEGALAIWEKSPDKPDQQAIATLHERALWGARLATQATANPIFSDYASSYVGWNTEQKRSFRGGQAAHGRARAALKSGDFAAAAAAGRECADLARPLGDWWGLAMGLAAEGEALAKAGKAVEAATSLAHARQIYHDLGLVGAELTAARGLAQVLAADGPPARARAALQYGLELAERLDDAKSKAALKELEESLAGKR